MTPHELNQFINRIFDSAVTDHRENAGPLTGEQICQQNACGLMWRNGHKRLASTIYNKTRWTLLLEEGRDEEASRY